MKKQKVICSIILSLSLLGGCTAINEDLGINNATGGTLGGAGAGALIGQIIGQDTKGTLIGAGIGALAGLGWGAYKDQQTRELQARLRNTQVRVTDEGNYINLTLPGGVTFPTNGYYIGPGFYPPLNDIAAVLNQYKETRIVIAGNTDNTGSYAYNEALSVKRARSVADYLAGRGVAPSRITITGNGPNNPIASNATAAGRAQNRRVEIQIYPMR